MATIKNKNMKNNNFEFKSLWDEYENGVPEMTPEQKKKSDMIERFCYGTSEPLWK
jgi:hypothetical protein